MTRGDQTHDSTRRRLRSPVTLRSCVFGSGGGFDGDPVAEGGELGDVVTHAAFDVDAAGGGGGGGGVGGGGGFDGDPVAEGGELGDVVTHAAFDVDAAGVVVGSEVMEAGEGGGE